MRHEATEEVIKWRDAQKHYLMHVPECCHTCDYYNDQGVCTVFNMTPPEDFAGTDKACDQWDIEIPF